MWGGLAAKSSQHHEATSPRTFLSVVQLSAKTTRHEDAREALSNLYELTFLVCGPTSHVIYSRM
jgi:hypothetical protein